MAGSTEVKKGFLMSISQANLKYVGLYYAGVIAKIFNGAEPGDIDQIFEDPQKLAINVKTAQIIVYDPPLKVLEIADEIYEEIPYDGE